MSNVYIRPEHRANGGTLKFDFEGLGMQRWNKSTDRDQKSRWTKCVHFFIYHVYFQSNGY